MYQFLTLAITETFVHTGEFNVIAMGMKSQTIIPISLTKEQIVSETGEIFWDIGFVTNVDKIPERKVDKYNNSNENHPYIVTGSVNLGDNKSHMLKAILDAKSKSCNDFFSNEKHRFCIVKSNKLEDMSIYNKQGDKELRHYIKVRVGRLPAYENPKNIRIKDYRWINFWNWIYKNQIYEEKKKKYLKLFNKKEKELFLILYRHKFQENSQYWVVGLHWF